MDRNTLLAFFLIALVLLFTPKYIEVFNPQKPVAKDEASNLASEKQIDSLSTSSNQAVYTSEPESFLSFEKANYKQTINEIETDLYIAQVSSYNGGSLQSFYLKTFGPRQLAEI